MSKTQKESILFFAISICCIILFFIFARHKAPFIYQTNDDLFLEAIVSGQITGSPDAHMVYVEYPVGILLSTLYNLFPKLPWYGLFLCFCIGLSLSGILWKLLVNTQKILFKVLLTAGFLLGSYSFIFLHIAELQFTFVTSCLASLTLALLVFYEPKEKFRDTLPGNIYFYIIAFLSFNIRQKGFLMMLPFILLLFGYKYFQTSKASSQKEKDFFKILKPITAKQKNILYHLLIFLTVLGISVLIHIAAYSAPEWKEYMEFNRYHEELKDYAGFPDYQENKEIFSSFGISEEEHDALDKHFGFLFVPSIDVQSFRAFAEILRADTNITIPNLIKRISPMTRDFLERHINYTDRPLNLLVYLLYFFTVLLALLGRKKDALTETILILIARMVIWCYLLYYGRIPSRVTQGIYYAELSLLLSILWKNRLWEGLKHKKITLIFWYIMITSYLFLCFRFGIPKAKGAGYESNGMLIYSESYADMKKYFRAHPENFYYLDMNSFTWYTKDAFANGKEDYGNFIFTGSWLSGSPLYKEKLEKEGIADAMESLISDSHVYVVFLKDDATNPEFLEKLLNTKYNCTLKVVEEIEVSNNFTYQIMKAYEKE